MISPNNPGMEGNPSTQHDDMNDAGHREQFEHADRGEKISDSDKHEGSPAQTPQEKREAAK